MTLIDGKAIAQKTHTESRAAVAELKARGFTPGLAVVLVGADPASQAYVRSKDAKGGATLNRGNRQMDGGTRMDGSTRMQGSTRQRQ